jgi:hypothetical protein
MPKLFLTTIYVFTVVTIFQATTPKKALAKEDRF